MKRISIILLSVLSACGGTSLEGTAVEDGSVLHEDSSTHIIPEEDASQLEEDAGTDSDADVGSEVDSGSPDSDPDSHVVDVDSAVMPLICQPGTEDCNDNVHDGCEINTYSDPNNCGGCGIQCSSNGGTATCSGGVCHTVCVDGFEDCDGDPTNGCEVDTRDDVDNCGGCGTTCNNIGGEAFCYQGRCEIECDSDHGDCDGDPTNGCEVDLINDPLNCGSCDNQCGSIGGTAVCANSTCGIQCAAGKGDCNGDLADGCETSLSTMANCGGCGVSCDPSSEICQAGVCTQIACTPGYGNCDGNAANGCETALNTLQNCGLCNNPCVAPPNMVATCTGSCSYTCKPGYANVDGSLTNGCEVNLKTNVNHCGSIGNICSSNGGTPFCSNGVCGITCNAGFEDCDGNPTNGCEVNLNADVNHCGSCTTSCSSPSHSDATCSTSGCGFACEPNWGDCDGNPANGCELDLSNDPNNCGGCGNVCLGEGNSCFNGRCAFDIQQVYVAPENAPIHYIAVDNNNVYWTDSYRTCNGNTCTHTGYVWKAPKTGGSATKLATGFLPDHLVVHGEFVYWNDRGNPAGGVKQKIMKTPVSGGDSITLYETTNEEPNHIAVDGSYVYWANRENSESQIPSAPEVTLISRTPVNRKTPGYEREIWSVSLKIMEIAGGVIHGTNLYYSVWGPNGTNAIYALNLETKGSVPVKTNLESPKMLASHGHVFWSGSYTGQNRHLWTSASSTPLVESPMPPHAMVADATSLVWSGATPSEMGILSIPVGGGDVKVLSPYVGSKTLTIDSTHVYWVTHPTWDNPHRTIQRAPR